MITSEPENSRLNGPTKYSITVVKQIMPGADKPVIDSSVYPIEKWESFFKTAAEGCRKTNIEPSDVTIEIRVGRETPQRHIQTVLKLGHQNGFRKTRISATKEEPKSAATEEPAKSDPSK